MKLNNQKRWKKTYLVTIGFAIYSVLTAVSYSAFPSGIVFKESGKIVWERVAFPIFAVPSFIPRITAS